MRSFSERDVRRHYDLLQHRPDIGLTQLKAMDGIHLFGVGLFDNEEDFVSECRRYNGLGTLCAGVNPRSNELVDRFGGLKNRMRSLFRDVVEPTDVPCVTGIVSTGSEPLSPEANVFDRETTRFHNGERFFALDHPLDVSERGHDAVESGLARWLFGDDTSVVPLAQFIPVMGTAHPEGGWLRSRFRFRRYRPYILDGVHASIQESFLKRLDSDGPS